MNKSELRKIIQEEVRSFLVENKDWESGTFDIQKSTVLSGESMVFDDLVSEISFRIRQMFSEIDGRVLSVNREQLDGFIEEFTESGDQSREFEFDATITTFRFEQGSSDDYPAYVSGELSYNSDDDLVLYVESIDVEGRD